MAIYIKCEFTPLGDTVLDIDPANPLKQVGLNGFMIELEHGTGLITATKILADTPYLQDYLNDRQMALPEDAAVEAEIKNMYDTVQQLLKTVKFMYGLYRLDQQVKMKFNIFWSLDRNNWFPVAKRLKTSWMVATTEEILPDPLLNNFAIKLGKGWEPFLAFEHLHKAFADRYNTRFQWINGATAAEQGIKEFLVRLKPELEPLLNELPSPPIPKLYKTILHAYTGTQSTYYRQLQDGADLRNKLVHKANHQAPSYQDTLVYLHTVECALIELHLLLEPTDAFLQYLLTSAQNRLNEVKTNHRSIYH